MRHARSSLHVPHCRLPCAELRNDETFNELPAVLKASVAFESCSDLLEASSMFGQLPRQV